MTIDELLSQGWADHAEKTSAVADLLEANAALAEDGAGASRFMHLAIHAIGDHLGERERATRLCEGVVKALGDEPGTPPLIYLAVARRLSGDDEGAVAAQDLATKKPGENTPAAAGPGEGDPGVGVRIGMLVAQGLMHGGDWDQAERLYRAQIATSDVLDPGHSAERACAVVSNNLASELLGLDERSSAQDDLMLAAARNAFTYWSRVGTWVNVERGHYLLALVHAAQKDAVAAREHAERGLAIITKADAEEPVDEAFLYLTHAAACRDLGAPAEHAASLERADALAAGFEGDGLVGWYQDERAKVC